MRLLTSSLLLIGVFFLSTDAQAPDAPCDDVSVTCLMTCEHGFKKDTRGCDLCQCEEEEVCKDVQCTLGKVCKAYTLTASGHKLSRCVDPRLPAKCQPAADTGPCRAMKEKYFYNTEKDKCEMFSYGGCKGNANIFESLEDCNVNCVCSLEVQCAMHCTYGYRKDERGCNKCECNEAGEAEQECSPIMCLMHCENGFKKDARGCDMCQCNEDNGQDLGEACPPVMCHMACANGFKKDERGCDTCACVDVVPMARSCEPVQCRMYCEHGYKRDARGCEFCQCQTPPESCPPVMCRMFCEHGFKRDTRGCEVCQCAEPVQINPLSECSDDFAVSCQMACDHGFQRNQDGCPTCECYEPVDCSARITCMMHCPAGFRKDADGCDICRCIDPEIDPIPVPEDCPEVMCTMYCQSGFQRDARGCPVCRCNDWNPADCGNTQCLMYCEHGFKKDLRGCQVCECQKDPCETVECRAGHKCIIGKDRMPKCIAEDVRTWCPRQKCKKYCENGFKSDQYGCEICTCLDEPKPDCPKASCRNFCPFGYVYDDNGCRGCKCLPDPCSIRGCDRLHVCEVKEADCPLCPATAICIGRAQVQRIKIEISFNHDEIDRIDFDEFEDLFRHRMTYLLDIDKEYIRGITVTPEGPSRTHVVFHAVSYGAGDIVANYETFERDIKSHQEGTSFQYGEVVFVPEHRTLAGSFYRDPEFYDSDIDIDDAVDESTNVGVIVGCTIAGAVALALLIVVIVFIVRAKRQKGAGRPKVAYKKAPAVEKEKQPLPDDEQPQV